MNKLFKGDKEERMEKIASLYFSIKKDIEINLYLSDGSVSPEEIMLERIENSYQNLESFERMIINNDFFYNDYAGWWQNYCSRNEYIKRRRRAINQFLRNFDNYEKAY